MLKVVIFDDVVAARAETFHIPGLEVDVYPHADDAVAVCADNGYDVVFMDFAMGAGRKSGAEAITAIRGAGYAGKVIATSSDPVANDAMMRAGADRALARKTHLRSFMVHLGATHLAEPAPA